MQVVKLYMHPSQRPTPSLGELARKAIKIQTNSYSLISVLTEWAGVVTHLHFHLSTKLVGEGLDVTEGEGFGKLEMSVNRHPVNILYAAKVYVLTHGRNPWDMGKYAAALSECNALALQA